MLIIIKSLLFAYFSMFLATGLTGMFLNKHGIIYLINSIMILMVGVLGIIETWKLKKPS